MRVHCGVGFDIYVDQIQAEVLSHLAGDMVRAAHVIHTGDLYSRSQCSDTCTVTSSSPRGV